MFFSNESVTKQIAKNRGGLSHFKKKSPLILIKENIIFIIHKL